MAPRRLLLIRHAQAGTAPLDAHRPLTEQGVRHARAIGSWLESAALRPDRVLVSPALRAVQTWEQAAAALPPGPAPVVDPRIYDNTLDAVLTTIRETPDDVRSLAVVGHNPSVGALAGALDDGRGDPAGRDRLAIGFPAGGVAVFVVPAPFAALAPGSATLGDVLLP